MMVKKTKGHISKESFDNFLEKQGMHAEAEDVAIKRVLAWQIAEGMKQLRRSVVQLVHEQQE